MSADTWPMIHAERAALAADLATLRDEQWSTPSLLPGWSVLHVLGHMTSTAKLTPPAFFGRLAASGFRFNKMSGANIARETTGAPADTLAEFGRRVTATSHPPGPGETWLGETIVHGEDIRRPLGIAHIYQVDAVTRIADFYKGSNLLIGSKRRIEGLHLRATDTAWSNGQGAELAGPLLSLVLAMTGRKAALADLSGPGLDTLSARIT